MALRIVFVAAEIEHGRRSSPRLTERTLSSVVFIFGLLRGIELAPGGEKLRKGDRAN